MRIALLLVTVAICFALIVTASKGKWPIKLGFLVIFLAMTVASIPSLRPAWMPASGALQQSGFFLIFSLLMLLGRLRQKKMENSQQQQSRSE